MLKLLVTITSVVMQFGGGIAVAFKISEKLEETHKLIDRQLNMLLFMSVGHLMTTELEDRIGAFKALGTVAEEQLPLLEVIGKVVVAHRPEGVNPPHP